MKRLKYEWYPEKNVIYLSKHSAIRRLTRVMVMRALENGFVEVFNMDDLTFETAGTREIRKCPISLQSLNPSIITIKLFNIECCKEIFEEPSVVLNRISELLNHKLLCAFIRQFDVDLPIVDIYYNNNTTNLFYQQLLDDGLFVRSNEVVVEQPR